MQLKKELGKNIKKFRKLKNITQERLAELVDVEINSISSVETGRYFPSPDNLVKISQALKVPLSELFTFSEDKNYFEEIINNLEFIKSDKIKLSAVHSFIKSLL